MKQNKPKNEQDEGRLLDDQEETDSGMYLNLLADEPGEAEAAMVLNSLVDDPIAEGLRKEDQSQI